ncbi:MAG: hypothetical protein WC479_03095 [Candidatus Izemoplasmatales bacterium]
MKSKPTEGKGIKHPYAKNILTGEVFYSDKIGTPSIIKCYKLTPKMTKKIKDHLEENLDKNGIYNICLGYINTVNSFVDDNGNNHFEPMIKELNRYIREEIIGTEPTEIMVNGKRVSARGVWFRNILRREQINRLTKPVKK